MTFSPQYFSSTLLTWFDQHGRHNLPWQKNISAYRVWVSEIMLQQTQVNTVIPYFERFMHQFPNVAALANAHEDEVLHLWTGLGYYARARNLHRAAKIIQNQYNGEFPFNFEAICNLPGIGRSTAGAIFSIAFQQRAAILDGNVRRVLCRLFAIEGWSGDKKIQEQLWQLAEQLTPAKRVADYTQAIMDLGATLCTRSRPQCSTCPFTKHCLAYQQHRTAELPHSKPSKVLPIKKVNMLILIDAQKQVLLEKRPAYGIWGGLWSLPEYNHATTLAAWCETQYGCHIIDKIIQTEFRHTFSHYHLDITPIILKVEPTSHFIMESEQQAWYELNKTHVIGLPAPIKKLLLNLTITHHP